MDDSAERVIREVAWKKARLFSWLMLAAPVLCLAVGLLMMERGYHRHLVNLDDRLKDIIFFSCVAVGVLCCLTGVSLRRTMLAESYVTRRYRSMGQAAQHYVTVSLLVFGLCENPAVLGLVYFLLTGELQRMNMLVAMSVVFQVLLFPSRARLSNLVRLVKRSGDAGS